jgi:dihydropteroate synthase
MAQNGQAQPLRRKRGTTIKKPSLRNKNPSRLKISCPVSEQVWGGGTDIDLSQKALIMGILNITPDSFSDGGRFLEPDQAVRHAKEMAAAGADIIDVGGESTRPGSEPVSLKEEIRRVIPVIERLSPEIPVPISIDTSKAEVARRALQAGARWVNDISALRFDPKMADLVAESQAPVILMHMKGTPGDMQRDPHYESVVNEIYLFLQERIEFAVSAGIQREQIIIDPGIGFGKRMRDNLAILAGLERLKSLGRPILLGTSRKSFIGRVLDLPLEERLEGTAATLAIGLMKGARIFRVHDVGHAVRVIRMAEAILHEEQECQPARPLR